MTKHFTSVIRLYVVNI